VNPEFTILSISSEAMPKSLVIVESPAKAKTINKYLGENYIVEASIGHVKDLPKGGLSIDIEGGFVPTYEIIKGKEDVVKRLQNLAGRCDRVFIATDPDREGEAIASHIAQEIRASNSNIRRVLFHEITKSAITAAMQSPRDIDQPMVDAQEARRVMDRLIGYKVSPYLWRTFSGESKGLSAGRVQSVAVRLVVERERAINSFIPIEYWSLLGHFRTRDGAELSARLVKFDTTEIRNPSGSATELEGAKEQLPFVQTKAQAEELRRRALLESYAVSSLQKKEVKRNAPLPFTTSTLQQEASKRLKINPQRTMKLAQSLYEGVDLGARGRVGLITYMRTDSTRISDEASQGAQEFIYENYGKEYMRGGDRGSTSAVAKRGDKANVQDAHEAVRPTDAKITPKEVRKVLDRELADLYELIWSRFIASQMAPAIFDQTTLEITGGPFVFRASGRMVRFKGWMQVYADDEETAAPTTGKGGKGKKRDDPEEREGDAVLPENIRKGDPMALEKIETKQSFTKPPMRYTESLLIKEMESKGIGRPSTYAATLATVQDRGYVEQHDRKLHATPLGMKVCDALVQGFPALFDFRFTARMEGDLDTIAGGSSTYLKVMQGFYRPLEKALLSTGAVGGYKRTVQRTAMEQPQRSTAPTPNPQTPNAPAPRPTSTHRPNRPTSPTSTPSPTPTPGSTATTNPTPTCPQCEGPMVLRKGREGGEFYGCANYPNCRGTRPVSLGIKCPTCSDGDIVARNGGRYNSIFYGCSRYPDCRFTSNLKPVNRPCTRCKNSWLVEAWKDDEGNFLECPKCKMKA
jgi:DNA topoisomerase-1